MTVWKSIESAPGKPFLKPTTSQPHNRPAAPSGNALVDSTPEKFANIWQIDKVE